MDWSRQRHHAAYQRPRQERRLLEEQYARALSSGQMSEAWRALARLAHLLDGEATSVKHRTLHQLEEAIAQARIERDEFSLFELLNGHALLKIEFSTEAAMLDVQEMQRIAQARDLPRLRAIAEQYEGVVLTLQQRAAEAQAHLERARRLDDDPVVQAEIATYLSATISQGKEDAASHRLALSVLEEALGRISVDDYPGLAPLLLQGAAVLQQRLGELDRAEQTLHRWQRIAQSIGDREQTAVAASGLIQLRHRIGDHAGVLRLMANVERPANSLHRLSLYCAGAMSAAALGDPRARAWLTRASLAHAQILGMPSQDEKYHDAAMVVFAALGDHKAAFEHAQKARAALSRKIAVAEVAQRAKFEAAMNLAVKEKENEALKARQAVEQADRNALTLGLIAAGLVLATLGVAYWEQTRAQRRLRQFSRELGISHRRLEAAHADLAALHASRTYLLSAACHDMRESTHTLGLLAEVHDDSPASMRERLKDIRRCTGVLSEMMGNLLDLTRLEGERYEPQCTDFRLADVVEEVCLQLRQRLTRFNGDFHVDACAAHVFSDRHLVRRILINLLCNALKYTREGCVCVCACQKDGWVQLCIEDTGTGISQDKLQKIFSPYVRLEDAAAAATDGLGIGLAIVQRACDLLGIELAVRSTPGVGTRFELRIPAGRPEACVPPPEPARGRGELVVMLDDDPIGRGALERMLASAGYASMAAASADEALRLLAGRAPGLIIADYRLAVEEADGMTQALRLEAAVGGARVPMLLVTGSVEPAVAERAQALGVQIVYKPAGRERLLRAVAQALQDCPAPAAAAGHAPAMELG